MSWQTASSEEKRLYASEEAKSKRKVIRERYPPDQGGRSEEELLADCARKALAATTDVAFLLDSRFRLRAFNPAAAAVLKWEASTAIGQGCAHVLRCRNLDHLPLCGTAGCPLVRVLQGGQPLANEEIILGAEAAQDWEASVSVTPVLTPEDRYVFFLARDVSALKMANRMREHFVSMVSHELRTPLNSVHGFIELLLRGQMGPLNETQREYLGYASEALQQLLSLAEDVLFMARSDAGHFELRRQQVNIETLAQQVLESMLPLARKAEIVMSKDFELPTPLVHADPQRMKQVLSNLLGNAIKFTPPGGTVILRARPDPDDPQMVLLSVKDTGFGIAPEDQPHVFERFYQATHSMQSRMGGYGLGLTIARLIVEQHGGKIWFETVPNRGTTFFFTLPLYRESVVAEQSRGDDPN
ncbi:ATP-binding protein [Thermogemmatispora sp.]|uniref:ATP-binding protein n=1 Tax=Thermogemmatispora sp. TaxID=1968838 RepID=UPI001D895BC6|nr:ATP-binding protein [Thermogemmatispora sp.]MBX5451285.1 PAS domain-containing protein [Thermogemmatispora sp.]